jgi:hypothetical protein
MPRSRHILAMLLVIAIISTGFFLSYDDVHKMSAIVNHDQNKFMGPLSRQQPFTTQEPTMQEPTIQEPQKETYITYLPHRYLQSSVF